MKALGTLVSYMLGDPSRHHMRALYARCCDVLF